MQSYRRVGDSIAAVSLKASVTMGDDLPKLYLRSSIQLTDSSTQELRPASSSLLI